MTDFNVRFMVRDDPVGMHLLSYLRDLSLLILVHAHTRVPFLISALFLAYVKV